MSTVRSLMASGLWRIPEALIHALRDGVLAFYVRTGRDDG